MEQLGTVNTYRVDMGRHSGPSVAVTICKVWEGPHSYSVQIAAAGGPLVTRAQGITREDAEQIAALEFAILRSAYTAGADDDRHLQDIPRPQQWPAAAAALAAKLGA